MVQIEGIEVSEIKEGNEVIEELRERLIGRYTAEDIINPKTGEVIVARNEYMDPDIAEKIVASWN